MAGISRALAEMEGKIVMKVAELEDDERGEVSVLFYCADSEQQPVKEWTVHYVRVPMKQLVRVAEPVKQRTRRKQPQPCSEDGCTREAQLKGRCVNHYRKWKREQEQQQQDAAEPG